MVQPWYGIASFGRRFEIRLVEWTWTSFGRGLEKAKKVVAASLSRSLFVKVPSFATDRPFHFFGGAAVQRAWAFPLLGTRTRNKAKHFPPLVGAWHCSESAPSEVSGQPHLTPNILLCSKCQACTANQCVA